MPTITARASDRLIEDRKRRGLPDNLNPRLSRREGRIVLDFAAEPAADDQVATNDVMSIFVAENVTKDLGKAVVDLETLNGKERLILRRARALAK